MYSTTLDKSNQREYQDQTWENFKAHFCEAQKALRRTGALTLIEAINHIEIANLVQQGIQQALEQQAPPLPNLFAPAPVTCSSVS